MKKNCLIIAAVILLSVSTNIYAENISDNILTTEIVIPVREDAEALTLDEAVNLAKKNSSSLKTLNRTIETNEKEREDAATAYIYSTESNLSSLLSLLRYDLTNTNNLITKEVQEESIEYSMERAYMGIINTERDIELEKQNLDIANEELMFMAAKKDLGIVTEQEYNDKKLEYEKSVAKLQEKEKSLDEAYTSLNVLLGAEPTKKYQLTLPLEYEELELIGSLNTYISLRKSDDPNIKKKENEVDKCRDQLQLYTANSGSSYASLKDELADAVQSLEDEKTSLDTKMRNLYNSITTLETNYKNNVKELESMKSQIDAYEKKYEMGLITQLELKKQKYNIASMESTIIGQIYDHMYLTKNFEKPYLT